MKRKIFVTYAAVPVVLFIIIAAVEFSLNSVFVNNFKPTDKVSDTLAQFSDLKCMPYGFENK